MQAPPLQCGKYPNYRLAFYFNYYSGLSSCQKVTYVYEYIQNKDTVPVKQLQYIWRVGKYLKVRYHVYNCNVLNHNMFILQLYLHIAISFLIF